VDIRNIDLAILGTVTLTPGMMVTVFEKQPPPPPTPAPATETERLKKATSAKRELPARIGEAQVSEVKVLLPLIQQLPSRRVTPVNIDVKFPQ
jgi:hypothetical protein